MKLFTINILLFLLSTFIYGQEQVLSIKDVFKNRIIKPDDAIPLVDRENGNMVLLIFDGKNIQSYWLNSDFEIIKAINVKERDRKYPEIMGYVFEGKNYDILLANKKRTRFAVASFDFDTSGVEYKELDTELGKEKFLQTSNFENNFCFLSISHKSSIINAYKFDNQRKNFIKIPLDLSSFQSMDFRGNTSSFFKLLTENVGFYGLEKNVDLVKFETENPHSVEMASTLTKYFDYEDGTVTFTFDENYDFTQILNLNLKEYTSEFRIIPKPYSESKNKRTNSFIKGDTIAMVGVIKDQLKLQFKKINTGETIREYTFNSGESVSFSNTDIIQTGGTFNNNRSLDRIDQLIRKVRKDNVGISLYRNKNSSEQVVSFGGIQEKNNSGFAYMPMGGIPVATIGAVTVFINPAYFAYENYTTKAIEIKALADADFNHMEGEIPENPFERIKIFEEQNKVSPAGKTIFRIEKNYFLGYYDYWEREYKIHKF
ncbi:hypothetical protein [Maribacter cobaltidurans]|uniref:Uncharacterized protein n=1 Tax=Maribacter cobaltidurans TaxID=1178778 RepID=A0A223V317_9FLAO|nr:hypothetical protein [Maribacter cobaltidurans]ASV29804.1 hypothetical protein CJ263_05985 [Maribacter cobaltidurans]GGD92412.1 hypothetical protein GCM10011412_32950 [Maribacter cobaltidurans]